MKNKNVIYLTMLMVLLFFLIIAKLGVKDSDLSNDNDIEQNESVESSNTDSKPSESKYIEGLTAVDVYGNFENIGFAIDKRLSGNIKEWICTLDDNGISYRVVVLGDSPSRIISVEGIAILNNSSIDISGSKQFFKYLSTIPYANSNPEKVKSMIDSYFNSNGSVSVGGITFSIKAPTNVSRYMEVKVD